MDRAPFQAVFQPRVLSAAGTRLKPGIAERAGQVLTLRPAFQFDDDDARYPGEVALENPDRTRDVFGEPLGDESLFWIASGDVRRV